MSQKEKERHIRAASWGFGLAFVICLIITRQVSVIFFEPLMFLWLIISSGLIYGTIITCQDHWTEWGFGDSSQIGTRLQPVPESIAVSEAAAAEESLGGCRSGANRSTDRPLTKETVVSAADAASRASSDLFLHGLQKVVVAWRRDSKAAKIVQAFLHKSADQLASLEQIIGFELHLRDQWPDGTLGKELLWVTAHEKRLIADEKDELAVDAPSPEFQESFSLFVRLLPKNCPTEPAYPLLVYAYACWVLLREQLVQLSATRRLAALSLSGKRLSHQQLLTVFVARYDDQALQNDNLFALSCLLLTLGQQAEHSSLQPSESISIGNPLLILDQLRTQVSEALDQQKLDRFERELLGDTRIAKR